MKQGGRSRGKIRVVGCGGGGAEVGEEGGVRGGNERGVDKRGGQ